MTKIIKTIDEWQNVINDKNFEKKSLGFVPTMGALHDGHISLVKKSISENDLTAVSIFVNPTQFNDKSDLEKYPRNFEKDIELLGENGTDFVFSPDFETLYPDNYKYKVWENDFSKTLCGASRPGHFDGVLTVVMKLLNIIQAEKAYFGEKDYQQLKLIDGMAKAFFMKTEIIGCPIVREKNGLAMSSRNKRLNEEQLKIAPKFYEILNSRYGNDEIKKQLTNAGFKVDYIETFENRRFGAVYLGEIRLIDNVEI